MAGWSWRENVGEGVKPNPPTYEGGWQKICRGRAPGFGGGDKSVRYLGGAGWGGCFGGGRAPL